MKLGAPIGTRRRQKSNWAPPFSPDGPEMKLGAPIGTRRRQKSNGAPTFSPNGPEAKSGARIRKGRRQKPNSAPESKKGLNPNAPDVRRAAPRPVDHKPATNSRGGS